MIWFKITSQGGEVTFKLAKNYKEATDMKEVGELLEYAMYSEVNDYVSTHIVLPKVADAAKDMANYSCRDIVEVDGFYYVVLSQTTSTISRPFGTYTEYTVEYVLYGLGEIVKAERIVSEEYYYVDADNFGYDTEAFDIEIKETIVEASIEEFDILLESDSKHIIR